MSRMRRVTTRLSSTQLHVTHKVSLAVQFTGIVVLGSTDAALCITAAQAVQVWCHGNRTCPSEALIIACRTTGS
jgi:hypothetical protein